MATEFLDEAKRLLDLEGGEASLPTLQGLALMFLVSSYSGQDRAGNVSFQPFTEKANELCNQNQTFVSLQPHDLSRLVLSRLLDMAQSTSLLN